MSIVTIKGREDLIHKKKKVAGRHSHWATTTTAMR